MSTNDALELLHLPFTFFVHSLLYSVVCTVHAHTISFRLLLPLRVALDDAADRRSAVRLHSGGASAAQPQRQPQPDRQGFPTRTCISYAPCTVHVLNSIQYQYLSVHAYEVWSCTALVSTRLHCSAISGTGTGGRARPSHSQLFVCCCIRERCSKSSSDMP